jgi:polysaccharide biosynthesis protein PslH
MYGGGPVRMASLIEYLETRSTVDLISFAPVPDRCFGAKLEIALPHHSRSMPARLLRNAWRYARRVPPLVDRFSGYEAAIRRWLGGRRYDVVLLEHFWVAPYAPLFREHTDRLAIDLPDIYSELMRSMGTPFARMTERMETELLPLFDTVLVTSSADACRIGVPSVVYPNALPARPHAPPATRSGVAMSANFEYPPNAEGLAWFEKRVWPRLKKEFPDLELKLIGKGRNPVHDAIATLSQAQVAIVPLFAGSGTRVKILEAWQAGTPVVSTALGAEGLAVEPGRHLLIANDPDAFAAAIARLLRDSALHQHLQIEARSHLEHHYTWPRAWERLDETRALY